MNQSQTLFPLRSVFVITFDEEQTRKSECHYAIDLGEDVAPINKAHAEWLWNARVNHLREHYEHPCA
ncbi:MAG: hypothetical protein ACRCUW_00765 [Plesiomonas shigelloides]